MRLTTQQRRIGFWSLAGFALLVLIFAAVVILAAFDSAGVWLAVSLILLLLIIGAEIVLLMMEKSDDAEEPHEAMPVEPQPAKADDAPVEFEL